MSVEKHDESLLKLGNAVIDQTAQLFKLKENNDSYQISKSREVAEQINLTLKNALEEYEKEIETLKNDERHDIFHFKQMKIINVLINGTEQIMKLKDADYSGLDRILDNMRVEVNKLNKGRDL